MHASTKAITDDVCALACDNHTIFCKDGGGLSLYPPNVNRSDAAFKVSSSAQGTIAVVCDGGWAQTDYGWECSNRQVNTVSMAACKTGYACNPEDDNCARVLDKPSAICEKAEVGHCCVIPSDRGL